MVKKAVTKLVGLILLVGHESKMAVLFRLLPGNITDVTTVQDMLFRFEELDDKRRVFAAVVDSVYFSLENITSFIDHKCRVVMAANTNSQWIKDAMESPVHHMWMNEARCQSYVILTKNSSSNLYCTVL